MTRGERGADHTGEYVIVIDIIWTWTEETTKLDVIDGNFLHMRFVEHDEQLSYELRLH